MSMPIHHEPTVTAARAAVDAILLAQAFYREDIDAGQVVVNNCELPSVLLQTFGFLFATLRYFDMDIEDRLGVWLAAARQQLDGAEAGNA